MATMTITTTAQNAADLAAAVGWKLGLNGSANAAQIKQFTIAFLQETDRQYKDYTARLAVVVPPVIDPT